MSVDTAESGLLILGTVAKNWSTSLLYLELLLKNILSFKKLHCVVVGETF